MSNRLPTRPPSPDHRSPCRDLVPVRAWTAQVYHREISLMAWGALVAGGAVCWSMILSAM